MATGVTSEIEVFRDFLSDQLSAGRTDLSPEKCLEEFRAYQRERDRFKRETQAAIAQCDRGECRPLDVESLKERVRSRLAKQGITE